jgi:enoyl-CoA hydratase/carnithine racemase
VSLVQVVVEDSGVVTVTLDRPEARNALSAELCDELGSAFEASEVRGARCVVLRGAGSVFCAGADFAAVSGPGALTFLDSFEKMLETVARHPAPVIAAIHGAALGGGFQLATVCDFRVVADDAVLGIPSTRLGVVVNFENVQRLVLLTGTSIAKEILMTARMFTGAEAHAAGFVNQSEPADGLAEATAYLAARIASLAPLSVRGAKLAIEAVTDHLSGARHSAGAKTSEVDALVAEAYGSDDLQEGLRARTERRDPNFTGK